MVGVAPWRCAAALCEGVAGVWEAPAAWAELIVMRWVTPSPAGRTSKRVGSGPTAVTVGSWMAETLLDDA